MYFLRITFKSFKKLNQLTQNLLKLKNINIQGVFQIKKTKRVFTLLKSPHVNKKSREHFIYQKYTPKIDIKSKNIFSLINLLILIKKKLSENSLIQVKIIKNN
uniref:Ribosomal protein S10 n=1 Tax=Bremia lactucae TaxID=4779 RepID=A0A2P1H6M7_BRELC|nr:ribosomal protein S10 [Bremia lactucae]AVN67193.1 ribosomal protein S10 [Bremia lactucae]AZL92944.1 ribosomal protein S10 [Bremia lactucae]